MTPAERLAEEAGRLAAKDSPPPSPHQAEALRRILHSADQTRAVAS